MAGYAKVIALAAVVVSSALIISIFLIPLLVSPIATGNADGATDARRIVAIVDPYADDLVFKNVKASDSGIQTNSMRWTLDPFGRSMSAFYDHGINGSVSEEEKRAWFRDMDAQEKYMLVRLPEWLGGSKSELSAYRVFSAFDVASQCNVRYRDAMAVIEDPCHGNTYRVWDGMVVWGISSFGLSGASGGLFSSSILALPQMRLGVDSEGYIVAYKLDNSLHGDGVVGEGRRLIPEQLEQSNERMIQAANEYAGFELPFPTTVSGGYLVWLAPGTMDNLLPGQSFEGYEDAFSAVYQPRPLREGYSSYRITVFPDEKLDPSQAKATFDKLFGTASPECEQGCRYIIKSGNNAIARTDTEAEDSAPYAVALAWGRTSGQDIMVAIGGMNSSAEELLSIAANLGIA